MPGRLPAALLPVAFACLACVPLGSVRLDYEPAGAGAHAPALATIGVLPFEDGRPPLHMDFLFGAMFKTYIPLIPYVNSPYERLDEYQAAKAREEGHPATEPFPIAFAKAVALDLAKSGVASEVRMLSGPEEAASVDYVLSGKLLASDFHVNTTSYGLGFVGVPFWILPIPLGSNVANVEMDLSLRDRSGAELWTHHAVGRGRRLRWMLSPTVKVGSLARLEMRRYGRNDEGVVPDSCWAYHAAALREAMAEAKPSLVQFLASRGR